MDARLQPGPCARTAGSPLKIAATGGGWRGEVDATSAPPRKGAGYSLIPGATARCIAPYRIRRAGASCNPAGLGYDAATEISQRRLVATARVEKSMSVKLATILSVTFISCSGAYAQSQVIGAPPEASNMK